MEFPQALSGSYCKAEKMVLSLVRIVSMTLPHKPAAAATSRCIPVALRLPVFNALQVRWPQARIKSVCLDSCFHFEHSVRVALKSALGIDVPESKGHLEA